MLAQLSMSYLLFFPCRVCSSAGGLLNRNVPLPFLTQRWENKHSDDIAALRRPEMMSPQTLGSIEGGGRRGTLEDSLSYFFSKCQLLPNSEGTY